MGLLLPAITDRMYLSSWRSPSNIALIKYWGKHGMQLPRNPSLSFTLSACHTDMTVKAEMQSASPDIKVLYDGNEAPSFVPKISGFFSRLSDDLPWLKDALITIDSVNTFPHAAGIASSASSMSALALCLTDIDEQLNGSGGSIDDNWWYRVSRIARLGSGSAARSLFPVAAVWGKSEQINNSSDEYAIPFAESIAPIYHTFHDAILIVNPEEKKVSSSAGHALMDSMPYAKARYEHAHSTLLRLLGVMESEDRIQEFISIVESEALQLHGLMMMGPQPYILFQPDTLKIIREVWRFRETSGIPVCFTLDAGPNVHLLYPEFHKGEVQELIQSSLLQYCQNGIFILDQVGEGPVKISLAS